MRLPAPLPPIRVEEGAHPVRRVLFALFCGALPWIAVGIGLYYFRSALLAFLFYHATCFIGGMLLRSEASPVVERRFSRDAWGMFGVGIAVNVLGALLYRLSGTFLLDKQMVLGTLEQVALPPSTYLWLFPYFLIVNPLAEEFYWRGGVYLRLRGTGANWIPAGLLTSLLFAAWHFLVLRLLLTPLMAVVGTLTIAVAGFLLTWVYERTRHLVYPVLLHAIAADLPLLVVLWLMQR